MALFSPKIKLGMLLLNLMRSDLALINEQMVKCVFPECRLIALLQNELILESKVGL